MSDSISVSANTQLVISPPESIAYATPSSNNNIIIGQMMEESFDQNIEKIISSCSTLELGRMILHAEREAQVRQFSETQQNRVRIEMKQLQCELDEQKMKIREELQLYSKEVLDQIGLLASQELSDDDQDEIDVEDLNTILKDSRDGEEVKLRKPSAPKKKAPIKKAQQMKQEEKASKPKKIQKKQAPKN